MVPDELNSKDYVNIKFLFVHSSLDENYNLCCALFIIEGGWRILHCPVREYIGQKD